MGSLDSVGRKEEAWSTSTRLGKPACRESSLTTLSFPYSPPSPQPSSLELSSYHIEQKAQKFIPGSPDTEGISSLAVSANRKFVAVAEKAEKGMITVYDLHTLKRRKVLTTTDLGSKVRSLLAA